MGERASHNLWWCEKAPAKQRCRAADMGHLDGGGTLTGHVMGADGWGGDTSVTHQEIMR